MEPRTYSWLSRQDMHDYVGQLPLIEQSPKLSAVFLEFKKDRERQKRWEKRHIDFWNPINDDFASIDDVDQRTDSLILQAAIGSLPQASQRRLLLYFYFGYTHKEIAQFEGISRVAVTKSINIAIGQLKTAIGFI